MRKLLSFLLCLIIVSASIPVSASEAVDPTMSRELTLDNGMHVLEEIYVYASSRTTERTAVHKKSFYDGDTLIAVIAFTATFRYDGSSVSVVSKSVTQTDTYGGWSYKQESFTSSGGTVTLTGKLKYLLILNSTAFTMSMTCDANGNISY